jgi:2,3-dihydroxybenzoate decarboxylase
MITSSLERIMVSSKLIKFIDSVDNIATLLYYDQPQYDAFWSVVQELDVPVYFHPRSPIAQVTALDYAHSPWEEGAPHQFAVMLSNHIVGLCANGVFE